MQRPSSVGIVPAQQGGLFEARIPKLQSSEFFGRTSQMIVVEVKGQQLGQLPNLGRDGTCQRIFGHKTISGRLVYHAGQHDHKKYALPVNLLFWR